LTGSQKLASPESGTETDSNKDTHTDTARTAEKKIGAYQKNKGQVALKKEKKFDFHRQLKYFLPHPPHPSNLRRLL